MGSGRKYDVAVIGGGLTGLMAAARAASRGKDVLLLAAGSGALCLSSGCIDVWGYGAGCGDLACRPVEEVRRMVRQNPDHPYARAVEVLEESLEFFLDICRGMGISYVSAGPENQMLPTALGTLRPTYLAPASMVPRGLNGLKNTVVVGFKGLKNFFPGVAGHNLQNSGWLPPGCRVDICTIDLRCRGELKAESLAFLLEKPENRREVARQLGGRVKKHSLLLFPAALGVRWDSPVAEKLELETGCQVIELPGLPPSLPGKRLQDMLLKHLRNLGVEVRPGCTATGPVIRGKRCQSVFAEAGSTREEVFADRFILCTGSFLGGGLEAGPEDVRETVFGLPVWTGAGPWERPDFLSRQGQPFSGFGLQVNSSLLPVRDGREILENVLAAGAILARSDFVTEKCGNGLALATGYKAGSLV